MRDIVVPFPQHQKSPIFGQISVPAPGTVSSGGQGTYILKDNSGATVASGNVDGTSGGGTVTLTEWHTIDGAALALLPGVYVLEFNLPATPSDTINRTETPTIILYVPGTQAQQTYYPTGDDLQQMLAGMGVIGNPVTPAQKLIDLNSAMQSAWQSFEEMTGKIPFLASSITTRQFHGTGDNTVVFSHGLVSLDAGADAIQINGTNYTLGTNVFLLPDNAPAQRSPYTYLKFGSPTNAPFYSGGLDFSDTILFNSPGRLSESTIVNIRGLWGHCLNLPTRARECILFMGALESIPSLQILLTGGLVDWKEADVSESYGQKPYQSIMDMMENKVCSTIEYYKRRSIV